MLMYALSLLPLCGGWTALFAPTANKNVGFLKTRRIWKCRGCRKQFSVKTGTIFEESPIALDKWLMAIWLLVNCKNGISSYEIARDLKVTQKSAWFMLHRIRLALKNGSWERWAALRVAPVEIDETFVGGKLRNMHKSRAKALRMGAKGQPANAYHTRHETRLRRSASLIVSHGRYVQRLFPTSNVILCRTRFLATSTTAPQSTAIRLWLMTDSRKTTSMTP